MDMKRILLVAVVVWFGVSAYWYTCKIKGRCGEESPDKIEVIDSVDSAVPGVVNVYFQPNTASYLKPAEVDVELKRVSDYLKNNSNKKVTLTGYTANLGRAAGYNQMALARVTAVKQKLVGMGVTSDQIETEAKGIQGQTATTSEDERAKSRRVEIVISSK